MQRDTRPALALLLVLGLAVLLSTLSRPVQAQQPGSAATTTPSQTLDPSTVETFQRDGVKLNFEDVDIKTLARIIGQLTGRNIILDQKVQGKVTLVSPNRLSTAEAWEMFVSALEAYNFGVEYADGVYHISPIATVKQRTTGIYGGKGRDAKVLVAVVKVTKISSEQAVNALRPLLTPTGVISAIPNTNTVVVMDETPIIKRVIALAKRIDSATEKASLRIYYPTRVRAADVSKNLESLFPDRASLRITVHQPTNSLLVLGLPEQHRVIERLLASLERRNQTEAEPRQFWVYYLQFASADDTAKILAEMLSERLRLEQQQAQSGIPTASQPGVSFPLSNPNASVIPPPSAMPAGSGNPALPQGTQEPSREYPNPQPTPFQQGAETRTSSVVFPVSPAQLPINQMGYASSKVSADVSNNALVFYMTATEYGTVRRLVEQLDIPRKQVLVSAIVAEVSPKRLEATGIQWQATIEKAGIIGLGAGQSIEQLYQTLQTGNFVIGTIDPTQTSIDVGGRTVQFPNNYALLNFLTTTTDFNLLASPRLLTHNNKQADISVGKIVPFATGVKFDINGQPIINFDYREVGLNLKLTPHISQGQNVRLEVHQDLQEVVDYIKTGTGATAVSVPVVSKREVNSEVSLGDGQTLVIGGLVQRTTLQTIRKVPVLGDIPFLGDLLFRQKDRAVNKTTLFVFLTPHIVDSPQKARDINDQYQQMYERAMRVDKTYNEDLEYHPSQAPRVSPKDPTVQPLPGPGPVPTPELRSPSGASQPGSPMLPAAPPSATRPPSPSNPTPPSSPAAPGASEPGPSESAPPAPARTPVWH